MFLKTEILRYYADRSRVFHLTVIQAEEWICRSKKKFVADVAC